MSSVAQMLRQAEALKASVSDSSKTISETWGVRQKLEDTYKKVLLVDLEYALDKKVEQELWNFAFKNQITNLQTQAKDRQNVKRAEIQASLNLFLETASGFYLQFLQLLCTTFKLDLPFRRKSSFYGIMREKTPLKLKVTPPKKSSCLYVCQYCLVHLGDIARYRQQIDQAQTYYWHAASLVPFNGQPYNQLAILEAAKGNKLSTVFYYIRSLAVKVPFPVAATNLEKLYAKLAKETPDFKGKLSASEMITGFLQFHALVHLCTDLEKAEELGEKLAAGLSAHVTSQSFPWQVLVQIVAINLFAMNHVQLAHGSDTDGLSNGDDGMTDEERICFDLVFNLTVTMLDILLQYTPKQEHKVREYFTLPAIKLLLDWFKINPQNFDRPALKFSPLWGNLCKVLNNIQVQDEEGEEDMAKYEDFPLPEDAELRCFQPIEKAQSSYSYSKVPAEGVPVETEVQLRCQRLLEHGHWIMEEHSSVNMSAQIGKSGKCQFTSTTPSQPTQFKSPRQLVATSNLLVPSPERKTNRQNVAIQAIMQKQAKDNKENIKMKGDPSSPKYLLGVPTSEPLFFKTGSGGRQSNQSSPSASKSPTAPGTAQTGGVLVLKNQEHLSLSSGQTSKPAATQQQQQKSQSWQQQQQRAPAGSSWQQTGKPQQQQQQMVGGKSGWQNTQISPQNQQKGHGQVASWQQQPNSFQGQPQMSPQGNPGQWQFPNQAMFGRNDLRSSPMPSQQSPSPRAPMMSIQNMAMMPPQAPMFSQGQGRPGFPQGQGQTKQGQLGAGGQGEDQYLPHESQIKGHMTQGQMKQGQMTSQGQGQMAFGDGMNNRFLKPGMGKDGIVGQGQGQSPADRFGVLNMSGYSVGDGSMFQYGPGQPTGMFRHPPPPNTRFPPPPNFVNPSMDGQVNIRQGLQTQQMTAPSSLPQGHQNFAHAPGTERPMGVRPVNPRSQNPQQIQMPYTQGQVINPMHPPFMGFQQNLSNNQMKSPLEGLFGNSRFQGEELTPNVADIIGTLTKMSIQQQPRDNVLASQRIGNATFQGHAEGTPKPENFYEYQQQRSSSVPVVNIDMDTKLIESAPVTTVSATQVTKPQPQQGTYSLFSGSPWLSSGDSKSLGSSPFSSQSSSMRNSPDPNSDTFNGDNKSGQVLDMGLRFSNTDERGPKQAPSEQQGAGPFFQNNMQSIWSTQSQSPLERLLQLQKQQQRQAEPH